MIEIKVNGNICNVAKCGKLKDLTTEYLNGIMCIIEAFSGDIGVSRTDVLTLLYNELLEIYNDKETEIKEV